MYLQSWLAGQSQSKNNWNAVFITKWSLVWFAGICRWIYRYWTWL